MEPIRVLIADDHPLYRDGMRGLLDSETGTEVVGEASSGEEAIELAEKLQGFFTHGQDRANPRAEPFRAIEFSVA